MPRGTCAISFCTRFPLGGSIKRVPGRWKKDGTRNWRPKRVKGCSESLCREHHTIYCQKRAWVL